MFILLGLIINISPQKIEQPKLIVSIVVDQMRFDDLFRFYHLFGDGGFKELISSGTNFTFANYNYEPTTTGPGHASIFTGSIPYFHGIIGNDFFDKSSNKMTNCVKDNNFLSVGSSDEIGKCSPKKLLASTLSDQLKLYTNLKSKVFSISIKDRGAILPVGHLADAAYWYNYKTGDFISSSYYVKALPDWLNSFNSKKLPQKYMSDGWDFFLDKNHYSSNPDFSGEIEVNIFNVEQKKLPYQFNSLNTVQLNNAFQFTPYSNQILIDLAKELITNESLGKDNIPDFLSVSFSALDIMGHTWGNFSNEIMDTYLRLDRNLADFISFLNKKIGKNNYLLFLTSDHGAIETPSYLKQNNFIWGELNSKVFLDSLNAFATRTFGSNKIIRNFSNRQIYIDRNFLK